MSEEKEIKTKKRHGLEKYTQELALEICDKITQGLSLRKIAAISGMPSFSSILRWLTINDEFLRMYNIAKEEQAELFADEIVAIADEKIETDVLGKIDGGKVNQARLRVEARKWVASRLKPKKYGDATTLRGDADAPLIPILNLAINK